FSLKQQRILAHDPVNTFGIDRRHTIKFGLSAKQRPYLEIQGASLVIIFTSALVGHAFFPVCYSY
ncbi:TPA: hypothetical protein ACM6YP_004613, partial [Escherichia coli]